MTNPADILAQFIVLLRAIPELVAAMNDDDQRIAVYGGKYPAENSLARAIDKLQAPGILVAYMGTGLGSLGQGESENHLFSIYGRAAEESADDAPAGYYQIGRLLVDGTPSGQEQKMQLLTVHTDCYPMRRESRWERRSDIEQVDYFEMQISFSERW